MVKIYPGEYSVADLAAIEASRFWRTGTSPFTTPGRMVRYVGKAVGWKGAKKMPGEKISDYLKRLYNVIKSKYGDETAKKITEGLGTAIDISIAARETYGVAVIETQHGIRKVVPLKVVKQMTDARTTVTGKPAKPVRVIASIATEAPAKKLREMYGERGLYQTVAPIGAVTFVPPG